MLFQHCVIHRTTRLNGAALLTVRFRVLFNVAVHAVEFVPDKMDSVYDGGLSQSHDMPQDDRAMHAISSVQGPVYRMCLDREQLSTKTLDLDDVLSAFQIRIVAEERADLLPDFFIQVLTNLAVKFILKSGSEILAISVIYARGSFCTC